MLVVTTVAPLVSCRPRDPPWSGPRQQPAASNTRVGSPRLASRDLRRAAKWSGPTSSRVFHRAWFDIDDDLDDAVRSNDVGRICLAQSDREYLIQDLSRAVGLGGRTRHAGATTERARTSVTRSIRYAMTRIAEHHPPLGRHLRQAINTGTYCEYKPDPRVPLRWVT